MARLSPSTVFELVGLNLVVYLYSSWKITVFDWCYRQVHSNGFHLNVVLYSHADKWFKQVVKNNQFFLRWTVPSRSLGVPGYRLVTPNRIS